MRVPLCNVPNREGEWRPLTAGCSNDKQQGLIMRSLFKTNVNAFSLFLFVLRKKIRDFFSFCRKIKSLHYPQTLQNASPII